MTEPFSTLLGDSFRVLADEASPAHDAVIRHLGSLVVALEVDGEEMAIVARPPDLVVERRSDVPADVRIRTTRDTIAAVIDGHLTLQETIDTAALEVIGDLDTIARVHDAFVAYTHGAVRSPTFPTLMARLRAAEVGGMNVYDETVPSDMQGRPETRPDQAPGARREERSEERDERQREPVAIPTPWQDHSTASVLVIGGGVTGLTVAHELADRGFWVTVLEKATAEDANGKTVIHVGGMAATQDVKVGDAKKFSLYAGEPEKKDRGNLHGEHGFRFFPSYYQHLFDTMRRIPIYADMSLPKNPPNAVAEAMAEPVGSTTVGAIVQTAANNLILNMGRTVYDNVIPCPVQAYAGADHHTTMVFPRQPPVGAAEFLGSLAAAREAGFSPTDLSTFFGRILRYLATCPERRAKEFEDISAYEFLIGMDRKTGVRRYHYTRKFEHEIEKMPRVLAAFDSRYGDARTNLDTYVQLQMPLTSTSAKPDGVLNGPTTEAWFIPWQNHLVALGVKFVRGELAPFRFERGFEIKDLNDPQGCLSDKVTGGLKKPTDFTYIVVATDAPAAASITSDLDERRLLTKLRHFVYDRPGPVPGEPDPHHPRHPTRECGLGDWDRFQTLSGIQYYFDTSVQLVEGHVYFKNAPWGLSSINQHLFWQYRPTLQNNGYQAILSVDIGEWNVPAGKWDRTAKASQPDDIANEVWRQITKSLTGHDSSDGLLPTPKWYTLDKNLDIRESGLVENKTPYLIPIRGDWKHRPGAEPWNPQGEPAAPEEEEHDVWQAAHGGYQVLWDRLVFAGTWTKTFTRMTSMEAACESGRHAANAILDHWIHTKSKESAGNESSKIDERGQKASLPWRLPYALDHEVTSSAVRQPTPAGDYCAIFDIEYNEPVEFRLVRLLDKWYCEHGLPHPWEMLGIDTANSIASWLTASTSKAYDSYDTGGVPGVKELIEQVQKWREYVDEASKDVYEGKQHDPRRDEPRKEYNPFDPYGLLDELPDWARQFYPRGGGGGPAE
jgi:uncharacterized protein with NAD-binding domain and iron-sulfur cluster